MTENKTPKGKTPNKFRQVLLIEGKPAPLYADYPRTRVSVIVDGETYRLGYMANTLVDLLRRIPGATVETEIVNSSKTVGLRTVRGLHIRKAGDNTTIEVSAPTEEALAAKIAAVTTEMEESNVKVTQRCSWICVTDLAHPEQDEVPLAEPTIPPIPAPKPKREPGRHGLGIPPEKKNIIREPPGSKIENTDAMKKRIAGLRELAIKKGLIGVMPNTPPVDIDIHGD